MELTTMAIREQVRTVGAWVALGSMALAAGGATAAPGDFTLYPDHEQVRAGLPATTGGAPGGAYCGPTSAADVINWLNDNGYPELGFDDTNAATITLEIFGIGLYLSTHPDNGTTPADFVAGLQDLLDDGGLGDRFEVSYVGRNMGSVVEQALGHSFGTIGLLLNVGNYVIARVGWYEPTGVRCGGHYVAVTGYDFAADLFTARFRDPSDGALQVRQRSIADGFYDLEDPNTDDCAAPCIVNQYASSWTWARSPSSACNNVSRNGYQDGIVSIRPIRLFSRSASGGSFSGYRVANGQASSHAGSNMATTSIALHPHLAHIYHCRPGENLIYRTDIVTDQVAPVVTTASLNQPRRLLFGSGARLYVLQGPAAGPFTVLGLAPDGTVFAQTSAPTLTALGYWEAQDRIVLWSGPTNQVQAFTPELAPVGPTVTLPAGATFANPGYLAVDPSSGVLFYNHNGSSSIFRYDLAMQTPLPALSTPALPDPADMAVDNRGHLFVAPAATGPVVEWDAGGMLVTNSRAAGFDATSLLALTRAVRRPLLDDYTGGRRDNDMPIDLGDFDGDLDVDSADFAAFAGCFAGPGVPYAQGEGCHLGDFDFDADVDCDDHTAFAVAWTAGTPAPVLWECRTTTGVPAPEASRLRLEHPYPNPFNPLTTVVFHLPERAHVTAVVHDVRGHRVKMLLEGDREAGRHVVTWNGRNEHAREMPAGIYTLHVVSAGRVETRKLVLVK
jgi:hypothetical protein